MCASETKGGNLIASFSVDTERPFLGADDGVFDYLELFNRLSIKSTFFVVGELAEKRPDIVDCIVAEGHEIACHAWSHPNIGEPIDKRALFVDQLDDLTLEKTLKRCTDVLSRGGDVPIGFRAPWFRVTGANFEVIKKYFRYDSSLGGRGAKPFDLGNGLIEIPISRLAGVGPKLGTPFLFGPGALALTQKVGFSSRRKEPLVLYGHSFDLSGCPDSLYIEAWKKVWYFNRCGAERKVPLYSLLNQLKGMGYRFVRSRDLFDNYMDEICLNSQNLDF